ncbi:MAG TPA: DUF308 domain-containing protein [Gemmataceae bacterium]|nr:DUF308 domain-containing protein [Gemmataceae bacterium]
MSASASSNYRSERRSRWKWLLILGIVLIILGISGITIASILELTSVLVFGPLLLVSSLMQFLTAFFTEKGRERLFHFAAAILEMVIGFLIMVNPPEKLGQLIVLVAVFLIIIGVMRLASSVVARTQSRAWAIFAGAVALVLGGALLIGGSTGAKVGFIAVCIALDFACHGISWSAAALMERKPVQEPDSRESKGFEHTPANTSEERQ